MNDRFCNYRLRHPELPYHTAYSRFRRQSEPANAELRKFLRVCRECGVKKVWIRVKPLKNKGVFIVPKLLGINFAYGVDENNNHDVMSMVSVQMGWLGCLHGVIQLRPDSFVGVKRYYNIERKVKK